MFRGETYVVVGEAPLRNQNNSRAYGRGWKITLVESAEAGIVRSIDVVEKDQEVESFFPGAVFPLSEYII